MSTSDIVTNRASEISEDSAEFPVVFPKTGKSSVILFENDVRPLEPHVLISEDESVAIPVAQHNPGGKTSTPINDHIEETEKDNLGYTNPNLHRILSPENERDKGVAYFVRPSDMDKTPSEASYFKRPDSQEIVDQGISNMLSHMKPNDYTLRIHGTDSYRTTTTYLHDDDLVGGPENGETEIP